MLENRIIEFEQKENRQLKKVEKQALKDDVIRDIITPHLAN